MSHLQGLIYKNCCGSVQFVCLAAAAVVLPSEGDSCALVHFTTSWSCTELQSGRLWDLAHSYTLSGKLLSGPALQCDPLDMQVLCLSHLGFAQLLEGNRLGQNDPFASYHSWILNEDSWIYVAFGPPLPWLKNICALAVQLKWIAVCLPGVWASASLHDWFPPLSI